MEVLLQIISNVQYKDPPKCNNVQHYFLLNVIMFLNDTLYNFQRYQKPERKLINDDQTIGFQGKHPKNMRISFKRVSYDFQCDSVCNNLYILFFIFFRYKNPSVG